MTQDQYKLAADTAVKAIDAHIKTYYPADSRIVALVGEFSEGKDSVQLLIPKSDKRCKKGKRYISQWLRPSKDAQRLIADALKVLGSLVS